MADRSDLVTEAEWRAGSDLNRLVAFLRGRLSPRKQRLLAVACCRSIGKLLGDKGYQETIALAERLADGEASQDERLARFTVLERIQRQAAHRHSEALEYYLSFCGRGRGMLRSTPEFDEAEFYCDQCNLEEHRAELMCHLLREDGRLPLRSIQDKCVIVLGVAVFTEHRRKRGSREQELKEEAKHAALLRDTIGNPFQPAPTVAPEWLAWQDGLVPRLAEAVYEGRAFDRLPILGDALEDAGCTDEVILSHCREPGPHARGCWLIDRLTGRA